MDPFLEDLRSGDIHFRDKWQFELKSEFSHHFNAGTAEYTQEFYFFIPNSLHVKKDTYSKEDFYKDLTNLIRFKTPEFSLHELLHSKKSPIHFLENVTTQTPVAEVLYQLKLLGNVFRSSLRERIIEIIDHPLEREKLLNSLPNDVISIQERYRALKDPLIEKISDARVATTYRYLDEFISNTIDYFLTGLLHVSKKKELVISDEIHGELANLVLAQMPRAHYTFEELSNDKNEQILYRSGLLKKFVMDALMLPVTRSSVHDKYGNLIGSFAAGVAMLVYISLFVWQGHWFVINSEPFIILTVLAYILKDRLKEGLKTLSYRRALKWFSDFKTEIRSPDEAQVLGFLRESFSFVDEEDISQEIIRIRNREFHAMLGTVKRPEQVIYFKRSVHLFSKKSISMILRFDIHHFLTKASEPYHTYMTLDPDTKGLTYLRLPKVYHLNIILRNSFSNSEGEAISELKKFRIILDKNGIKNIEQVG